MQGRSQGHGQSLSRRELYRRLANGLTPLLPACAPALVLDKPLKIPSQWMAHYPELKELAAVESYRSVSLHARRSQLTRIRVSGVRLHLVTLLAEGDERPARRVQLRHPAFDP